MLRAFAMLIVFFGCSYLGVRASSALRLRRDMLRSMQSGIGRLSMWMDYTAQPLAVLARRTKTADTEVFWEMFAKQLKENADVVTAWQQAMAHARAREPGFAALKESDLCVLEEYAQGLGGSDRKTQAKNTALLQQRLETIVQEAQDAYGSKGRMYRSVGILSGLAAAILLW